MLRDTKYLRRNSGKVPLSEEPNENLPLDSSSTPQLESDPNRPPLNTIQLPARIPTAGPDQEMILRRKMERTPSKNQSRALSQTQFRTPEKTGGSKQRFGWVPKSEPGDNEVQSQLPSSSRGLGTGNGYSGGTPRTYRAAGKASSVHSDCSSTQSTPTKSVTKPNCSGFSSYRPPLGVGARTMNFSVASKGVPMSAAAAPSPYIAAEVPHFELREDPSFWMDHNVQVVIRVRPLNSTEQSLQGFHRCLKQESAQSITWIGQPESRFTFDYVACETISQEMLFRVAGLPMVENCMSGYNSCMFAYGQTGSGKTYTMLGEIGESKLMPSDDRGMTPRIFEFLFARIKAEEESRKDEKLKYNCKCSFLEIYNEQITDLLDPSSTNLLLREDLRKGGVYVENLSEFQVETVNDILKLLFQGAANRKVATTNMNRESSRSHSVFTCVIESRWDRDATTSSRYARLNLVDLAGSERQKTSGAEGERLKEAANINKSLSTLGHVIMVLADVANGRQRHVPYRDSKLTFLLQQSLGGNSKTMIIANISSSICSASETLSTLKFAQRARLIQNNAVVNEDASGDITALQHQIRLLKDELSLLKRQNVSRSLMFRAAISDNANDDDCNMSMVESLDGLAQNSVDEFHDNEACSSARASSKQLKSLEAILAGALRREKMADMTIKQLEAEIGQLNHLVHQREEDTHCSKMMLKFREDKIHRMEAFLDGKLPPDSYLLKENNALSEEIQLLRARSEKNPEVTRFASENIRLLDQLRRFQDFYEEGEREMLLTEVSELRNQLILILDAKSEHDKHPNLDVEHQDDVCSGFDDPVMKHESLCNKLKETSQELEECRSKLNSCLDTNASLMREINSLHDDLTSSKPANRGQELNVEYENMELCGDSPQSSEIQCSVSHAEQTLYLQLELDILKTILGEEKAARIEIEKRAFKVDSELKATNKKILQYEDIKNELKDARSVIEALESQHIQSLDELDDLRESNNQLVELLEKQKQEITMLKQQIGDVDIVNRLPYACKLLKNKSKYNENEGSPLQEKLNRMQASLEKARSLNTRFESDQASQTSLEREQDEVRRQVEAETTEVIVCLQEELVGLQQQVDESNRNELLTRENLMTLETELNGLHEKLTLVTQENEKLESLLQEREMGLRILSEDWERLASEISEALADGDVALEDAIYQVAAISDSSPDSNWVTEQVRKIINSISERDLLIEQLQKCLEDAQNTKCDMEWKLRSLRDATLAITEAEQQEHHDKESEVIQLKSELSEKVYTLSELQNNIRLGEERLRKVVICATVAFITVNWLSENNAANLQALEHMQSQLDKFTESMKQKDALLHDQIISQAETENKLEELRAELGHSQHHIQKLLIQLEQSKVPTHIPPAEHQSKEKLEDIAVDGDDKDLLEEKMRLNKFQIGVRELSSCMNRYMKHACCPAEEYVESADCGSEHRIKIESNDVSILTGRVDDIETPNVLEHDQRSEDTLHKETTTVLLRRELESALKSLKGVQDQMAILLDEKDSIKLSEIQSKKIVEHLTAEVLRLKSEIIDEEQKSKLRLLELEEKLQSVEGSMSESSVFWHKKEEGLELEISNLKAIVTQKTIEASDLLMKFQEVQETMLDADIMVNALMEANETAKLDIGRQKKIETTLNNQKNHLLSELQTLQSSFDVKEQEHESVKKNFLVYLTEVTNSVLALEDTFRLIQCTFTEKFKLIEYNLDWINDQLHNHTKVTRAWLEEIWLEIIGKDCAVSVLHHCHMGILLERITGLNAENGFLSRGLCESNSVISDLKKHNCKAKKELELCSILKGKLLVDINNSFNRIAKKEDETMAFKARLNTFEEKIVCLQLQEESMLDRSNSIGTELVILMEEMDASNRNASTAITAQKKLLREKDELRCQLEKFKDVLILNKVDMELRNSEIYFLVDENDILKDELLKVNEENSRVIREVQETKVELSSTLKHLNNVEKENLKLHGIVSSSEAIISRLQSDINKKCEELELICNEIKVKNEINEIQIKRIHAVEMENECLRSEQLELKQDKDGCMSTLAFKLGHCNNLVQSMEMITSRMFHIMDSQIVSLKDRMCREVLEHEEMASNFVDELELLELSVKSLMSRNLSLQSELLRIDEVSRGLSFDLCLLQESASSAKDQKDKLAGALETLEDEYAAQMCELEEAIAHRAIFEAKVQEKADKAAALELELSEKSSALTLLSAENTDLKTHMKNIVELKNSIEEELAEKINTTVTLEEELLEMSNLLGQKNHLLEELENELTTIADERDHLDSQVLILKEQIEMTQALAEEHEAVATEARQIAEERKVYAAEKEEEIKLLERSVEELECTVNALENKVEYIRGEAERQRLQREELEVELEAVRHQMLSLPASGNSSLKTTEERYSDFARHLKERATELQEAQQNIQSLQKEVAEKDAEIAQCKAHLLEVNMHAEAQAREYKKKFKELEAMAQQVKVDASSSSTSQTATKSEKGAGKSRGSGSPFKCIGLGIAQQMNSEKDQELDSARRQIEELQALAASRQREIFMLNTRLAAADSMTHDVIRDLLGVKLDMTSYAAVLDRHRVQKTNETSSISEQDCEEKDQLVTRLKKQLNKFIEERESWLDEIDQRQREMVAAQIALEKLQRRDQLITTENEMWKVDNAKYKQTVLELQDEVKKLTEQQNLHQRIHHHAKIKEENKMLRILNEELHKKLEKSEAVLARVKEELARYRAASGKKPFIDIDEEEKLKKKLIDGEEERIQLAEELMALCAHVLEVAGLSKSSSNISSSEAKDAVCQLKQLNSSLDREVQDQKLKCKLFSEKIKLLEVKRENYSLVQEDFASHQQQQLLPNLNVYNQDESVERG